MLLNCFYEMLTRHYIILSVWVLAWLLKYTRDNKDSAFMNLSFCNHISDSVGYHSQDWWSDFSPSGWQIILLFAPVFKLLSAVHITEFQCSLKRISDPLQSESHHLKLSMTFVFLCIFSGSWVSIWRLQQDILGDAISHNEQLWCNGYRGWRLASPCAPYI